MNVNEMFDIGFCLVEMTSTRFIWKLRGEDYNFVTFAYFGVRGMRATLTVKVRYGG